jgi:hypothetical protein
MSRIYISSSFCDLVDQRTAAAQAVRSLGRHPIVMEDYVALDERPLDKCLEDIRSCQVYVGILAWRYGYRPAGGDRSITELEYEEARASGIPCLFFLADEACKPAWPSAWVDSGRDGDAIDAFRRRVQERHMVSRFATPDALATKVVAAVSLTLEKLGSNRIEIPPLLPYMCDRSIQSDQLRDALDQHRETRPRRPMLVVVHGGEREAHHAFVERLQQITIPRLLAPEQSPSVHLARFSWSEPSGTSDERTRRLGTRVAEALTDRRRPTRAELAQDLARKRCPVMLCTTILSTDWQAHEPALIQSLCDMLAEWPDLPPQQLFMTVLVFVYKDLTDLGFWARRTQRKQNETVAAFVAGLPPTPGVTSVALAPLEAAAERDVLDWIDDHVARFCEESGGNAPDPLVVKEKMRPWVSEAFSRSPRIPTETLAIALRRRLAECFDGALD